MITNATVTIPPRSRASVAAVVVGSVLLTLGGLAVAAAIGLLAVFGVSGRLDTGTHQLVSSGSAVTTDVAKVQNTRGVGTITGWPTLRVTADGGDGAGVFVGIGRTRDVEAYLAGVAVDQVTDLNLRPFGITLAHRPGTAAAPPTTQTFWVASASSRSTADVTWPVSDGDYRLVIMNADGAPTVIAQGRVELTLPNAFDWSMLVLGGGLLVSVTGIVVLVVALRRRNAI